MIIDLGHFCYQDSLRELTFINVSCIYTYNNIYRDIDILYWRPIISFQRFPWDQQDGSPDGPTGRIQQDPPRPCMWSWEPSMQMPLGVSAGQSSWPPFFWARRGNTRHDAGLEKGLEDGDYSRLFIAINTIISHKSIGNVHGLSWTFWILLWSSHVAPVVSTQLPMRAGLLIQCRPSGGRSPEVSAEETAAGLVEPMNVVQMLVLSAGSWGKPWFWVNYNDLTTTSLESWLVREIIPKWP